MLIECVAALQKKRKLKESVEKGTDVVVKHLLELGYTGEFRTLNTVHFGLPQSRTRTYGVFVKLTLGFGPESRKVHDNQVANVWGICARCQSRTPESLYSLLKRSDLQKACIAEEKNMKQAQGKRKPNKQQKWHTEHDGFRNRHGLNELGHQPEGEDFSALRVLRDNMQSDIGLSEREADAALLCLGATLAAKPDLASSKCMVVPVGDSIGRMRFGFTVHPCLLPKKKYLYLVDGKLYVSGKSSKVPLMLQGIDHEELLLAGPAIQNLGPAEAQELCGNSFTANIVGVLLLAILANWSAAC